MAKMRAESSTSESSLGVSLVIASATPGSNSECRIHPRDLAVLCGQVGDVVVVRGLDESQQHRQALLRVWPDSKTPKGRE